MAHYMESVFVFLDIEFVDDTDLANCQLITLRDLTTCCRREAQYCGFQASNHPVDGTCYLIARNPDIPNPVIKDLSVI